MKHFLLIIALVLVASATAQAQSVERWLAEAELIMQKVARLEQQGSDTSLQQARNLAQRAKSIFRAHGERDGVFQAERSIALSYNDEGRDEESKRAAQEMLLAAQRAKSPLWEASALSILGFANLGLKNSEEAFLATYQAQQILTGEGIEHESPSAQKYLAEQRAFTFLVLGALHVGLGEHRTALVFLREGYNLSSQSPEKVLPKTKVFLLAELGTASLGLGDPQSAITYFESALNVAPDIGGSAAAIIHYEIADINLRMQHLEAAETHTRQGLALAQSSKHPRLIGKGYERLARLAMARGDDRSAEPFFEKATRPSLRADRGFMGLGTVFEQRGQLESALQQYQRAIESIETGLLEPRSDEQDRLNLFRERLGPYQRSLDVLLRLHFNSDDPNGEYARQAFEADQRIRNRMFEEQLAAAWNRPDRTPKQLEDRLAVVGQQMTNISRTLFGTSLSSGQQLNLRQMLDRLEVEQSTIRKKISIYNSLNARPGGSENWSVERVQQLLPAGTALLEYSMSNAPVVFVLTRERFEVVRLPRPDRLQERIATFFDLLSKDSGEPFGRFQLMGGYELFTDLIRPALRTLPGTTSHLIISPSGLLELVPFEALPATPEGKFLIEQYSISYLPSASTLEIIRERSEPGKRKSLLAFADPVYRQASIEDDEFVLSPLPYSRTEAGYVSSIIGDTDSDLFLGPEASESRLKTLDLTQYRVLHFATHAVGSRSHPDRSALVFTLGSNEREDGFLQVREIYDLRLNADLVVLSACQTGSGDGAPGEGVHGLARAFFFAGARSLVASLWEVEDEPTAALMTRFYQHLRKGLSKSDSLRQAKLDLIKEGSHPRHWAGFVLFGESAGALFSNEDSRQSVLFFYPAVASLIVGLLLMVRFLRRPPRRQ